MGGQSGTARRPAAAPAPPAARRGALPLALLAGALGLLVLLAAVLLNPRDTAEASRSLPRASTGSALQAAPSSPAEAVPVAVADGVVRRTLSYGPAGDEHTYDVYTRPGGPPTPRPTVVFVHGGSWEIGDKVEYVELATLVAQRGWTSVSVNYRRTPTAPWPAPLQDVREALRHVQQHAPALGVDVARTGALGDSVGAQLASLLGRPAPGLVPVRAVVAWSGVNDLTGLTQQASSGGCPVGPCAWTGLARKAVTQLMRCAPAQCPQAYRDASPAADLTVGAATFSVNGERELIDPRQAWAMDAALSRAGIASRVAVLQDGRHGRGNQERVWADSLRFLEATLLPETAPPVPRPQVQVSLEPLSPTAVGSPVRLRGEVRPRALGSSVALQVRGADGSWRTVRTAPLRATAAGTVFDLAWTPQQAGRVQWRATWRGGGGEGASAVRSVRVLP